MYNIRGCVEYGTAFCVDGPGVPGGWTRCNRCARMRQKADRPTFLALLSLRGAESGSLGHCKRLSEPPTVLRCAGSCPAGSLHTVKSWLGPRGAPLRGPAPLLCTHRLTWSSPPSPQSCISKFAGYRPSYCLAPLRSLYTRISEQVLSPT